MSRISRRDFLKISGAALAGSLVSGNASLMGLNDINKPNVIIILCDALSARHLSAYGYPRLTTPNIDAFAGSSTVYHSHYSGGNFTTTGTASMLTGMDAVKHRAFNQGGLVRSDLVRHNIYSLLGPSYYRFAFSQNVWSDRLLGQYAEDVDRFLPPDSYGLSKNSSVAAMFNNDRALASIAMDDFLFPSQTGVPGSLLSGYLRKTRALKNSEKQKDTLARYPDGPPAAMIEGYLAPYLNEDIYNGVYLELSQMDLLSSPYFAYFHLFSPHFPYRPRRDYLKLFKDEFQPVPKPIHPLSPGYPEDYLRSRRTLYDRQVAQLDDEFGKLLSRLEKDGLLENSYLILTADHGELFERGFAGHGFQFMYDDVLRIPLIIHAPGQTKREDVYTVTSNIDILPTLLSITGNNASLANMDGKTLPGFGGQADNERPVFSLFAADNQAYGVLKKTVISMRKGAHKLIAYLGYKGFDQVFELYDLENDPDELNDLATKDLKVLTAMQDELFEYLDKANQPFKKK